MRTEALGTSLSSLRVSCSLCVAADKQVEGASPLEETVLRPPAGGPAVLPGPTRSPLSSCSPAPRCGGSGLLGKGDWRPPVQLLVPVPDTRST